MSNLHRWMRETKTPVSYRIGSLGLLVESVRGGEAFRFSVREFLDDINLAAATQPSNLSSMIAEEPAWLSDPRQDAFVGGLAEYLAIRYGLARPDWSITSGRFLTEWWFPAPSVYDAVAIRESPAAFRRRGIFIPTSMLERV